MNRHPLFPGFLCEQRLNNSARVVALPPRAVRDSALGYGQSPYRAVRDSALGYGQSPYRPGADSAPVAIEKFGGNLFFHDPELTIPGKQSWSGSSAVASEVIHA